MKKIDVLKRIIFFLFGLTILLFLGDNILTLLALVFEKDVLYLGHFTVKETPTFLKILVLIKFFAFSVFVYGAFFLIRILLLKNLTDYFSNKTSLFLLKAGKFIVISNLITFLLSFSFFFISPKYLIYFSGESKYLCLLMIVFGLFLIIFSKVLRKARALKQENDLTI